jgi:hypothetical protein
MRYILVGTGNISNAYVAALTQLQASALVGGVSRSGRHFKYPIKSRCDYKAASAFLFMLTRY